MPLQAARLCHCQRSREGTRRLLFTTGFLSHVDVGGAVGRHAAVGGRCRRPTACPGTGRLSGSGRAAGSGAGPGQPICGVVEPSWMACAVSSIRSTTARGARRSRQGGLRSRRTPAIRWPRHRNGRRGEQLRDSTRANRSRPGASRDRNWATLGAGSVPLTSARAFSRPRMLSVVVITAWSRPHGAQGVRGAVRSADGLPARAPPDRQTGPDGCCPASVISLRAARTCAPGSSSTRTPASSATGSARSTERYGARPS